jgi:hypothetical protein
MVEDEVVTDDACTHLGASLVERVRLMAMAFIADGAVLPLMFVLAVWFPAPQTAQS